MTFSSNSSYSYGTIETCASKAEVLNCASLCPSVPNSVIHPTLQDCVTNIYAVKLNKYDMYDIV